MVLGRGRWYKSPVSLLGVQAGFSAFLGGIVIAYVYSRRCLRYYYVSIK